MRFPADRRHRLPALALLTLVVVGVPSMALAETSQSDLVLIRQDDVVEEDLYAAGNEIQVAGRIDGDLVASAFGDLRIDGTVRGNVTAVASRVVITGVVDGSVRVIAAEVVIEGSIGGDLAVAGRLVTVAPTASIDRDVVAGAWRLVLDGHVGRGVEGSMRNVEIGGDIAEGVEIDVTHLTIADTARVGDDLAYRSANDAVISEGASIGGSVLARTPLPSNVRVVGLALLIRVLLIVFGAGLGLSMLWAATERAGAAAVALRKRPVASLGQGFGIVILPFVLVAGLALLGSVMAAQSVVPLLVVALPVVLGISALLVPAALVSPVPPAVWLGSRLAPGRSVYGQFLLGFVLFLGLTLVPFIGTPVLVVVVAAGIGGWINAGRVLPESHDIQDGEAGPARVPNQPK